MSSFLESRIIGYDPNWYRNLPADLRKKYDAERKRVGADPLPSDRPLAWGESTKGIFSSYENLPDRVKNIVREAEEKAFTDWVSEKYKTQPQKYKTHENLPDRVKNIVREAEEKAFTDWVSEKYKTQPQYPQYQFPQYQQPQPQYSFPYEKMLNELLKKMPQFKPASEGEMLQQARQYAALQIDPQLQALERSLQDASAHYEAQKAAIEAAYSTVPETAQRLLNETRQQAIESAIARGAGRSGIADYSVRRMQEPIIEQTTQAEAEKAAKLAALTDALNLVQKQYQQQVQELETRRGTLEAQQLANLKQLAQAMQAGDWERAWNTAQNLATMATQAEQFQQTAALNWAPYFMTTEQFRQSLPLNWAQTMGEVPNWMRIAGGTTGALMPLRSYAESLGMGDQIRWDPATGNVIIGRQVYTPTTLQRLGGQVINGRWVLPASILDILLQGVA